MYLFSIPPFKYYIIYSTILHIYLYTRTPRGYIPGPRDVNLLKAAPTTFCKHWKNNIIKKWTERWTDSTDTHTCIYCNKYQFDQLRKDMDWLRSYECSWEYNYLGYNKN